MKKSTILLLLVTGYAYATLHIHNDAPHACSIMAVPNYIEETGARADIAVRSILKNIDSKKRDVISADSLEPFFKLAAHTICIKFDGFSEKKWLMDIKPDAIISIDELFSVSTQ